MAERASGAAYAEVVPSVVSVEFIELDEPVIVYDAEVEKDESFLCYGVVLHNSPICRFLDGTMWKIDDDGIRYPPVHIRCRSTITYLTKSWRELGIDRDEVSAGTRASMNGQVPAELSYYQWFEQQIKKPADNQLIQDVLGPTRGKLLKQGKLPIDRFVNNDGDLINLNQLRKLEPEAFDLAGIGKVA